MFKARVALPRFDGWGPGTVISNSGYRISKDQRYRGMAHVIDNNTLINLHKVRAALDAITLDGAESVDVMCKHIRQGNLIGTYRNGRQVSYSDHAFYTFRPAPDRPGRNPRIRITAPCGETRTYSVKILDRLLSEFGA